MKVLIGDTISTSPTGDGTAISHCHPSHAKIELFEGQRRYLHFSVILRPPVLVHPWEANPRPPTLQFTTLLTELILPWMWTNRQLFFVYFHPLTVITVFIKLIIISPNINKYKICTLFSIHFFSNYEKSTNHFVFGAFPFWHSYKLKIDRAVPLSGEFRG